MQRLFENIKESGVTKRVKLRPSESEWKRLGMVVRFDQREFVERQFFDISNFNKYGWMYYPLKCAPHFIKCKLVVVLHDCGENALNLIMGMTGWARVAAANKLVLLFPQMKASEDEDGKMKCWDTNGYSMGDLYPTNIGG